MEMIEEDADHGVLIIFIAALPKRNSYKYLEIWDWISHLSVLMLWYCALQ